MATRRKPLAKTVERGYGEPHRRKVKAERPLQVGKPCCRCGWPMLAGQKIQLDHTDDRTGYLGWSHQACNVRASNQRRARLARRGTATRKSTRLQAEQPYSEDQPSVWVIWQRPRQHTRGW